MTTYKDTTTGKTFSDLGKARDYFCSHLPLNIGCPDCPLSLNRNGFKQTCHNFLGDHPTEAARLMGLETIDDTPAKPRLAEILGVEVGERFRIGDIGCDFWIDADGWPRSELFDENASAKWVAYAINHPEKIIRIPRLTEAEIERCRVYGARYVSRGEDTKSVVRLFEDMPKEDMPKSDSGILTSDSIIALVVADRFPSVKPGDCIYVDYTTPTKGA